MIFRHHFTRVFLVFPVLLVSANAESREFKITPNSDVKALQKDVRAGDVIVLENGVWTDAKFRFENLQGTADHPIKIRAQSPGGVILTGAVRFQLSGSFVTVSGLTFRNPNGQSDVFEFRSHSERLAKHCRVTDCRFIQTQPGDGKESRWLNVYGSQNRVDHCYLAGKQNKGTTLVVWVNDPAQTGTAGAHQIDHNHFGPRPKLGQNGGETIRIGTSDVSELSSQTTVEENFFERCDGEAEVVSNKSCDNIYRHNLFLECSGALTLRHGHRCVVDGNVFLGHQQKGTGGVRIIGSDHQVINNYFEGLRGDAERAAICLMNGMKDGPLNGYAPVRSALIAHNTAIDCKVSMEFGVGSSKKVPVVARDCLVSHNVFLPGKWELFRVHEAPVNFRWTENKHQSGPMRGAELVDFQSVDIELRREKDGLLRPLETAALRSETSSDVATDIDGEQRDTRIAGCDDPSNKVRLRDLMVTTGPSWD